MVRTRNGLPKHCTWSVDRHGGRRVRFQRRGFTTYLHGTPWSDDFMRGYAAALDSVKPARGELGAERTVPGSVNAALVSYYRAPDFLNLKASTQYVRRNILERFRAEHGDKPLRRLERNHVKEIIGAKAATPEAANDLLKALRTFLNFAVDGGMVTANAAAGVKRFKSRSTGFHSWTEEELAAFAARHATGSKARLAFALLLYSAQRRGDVVRMGWQHVRGNLVSVRQEKTGEELRVPIHPELAAELRAAPRTNLTFLMTELGAPFTSAGFGNWFRERCDEAGLKQCSAHGLRKAAARRLAEAGCTAEQIKAMTGHRTLAQVAHYTAAADQTRLARQAVDRQIGAEREQELSNPQTRLDNSAAK
jgi:integrase